MNQEETLSMICEAETLLKSGRPQDAVGLVEQAYAADPELRDGFTRLGGVYRGQKNWTAARLMMEKDFLAGRMSKGWQLRYAEVMAERGDMQQAERVVAAVYKEAPAAVDGYARLGGVFMRRKKWNAALQWMQRDVALGRISPVWQIHRAVIQICCGDEKNALSLIRKLYEKNHDLQNGYSRAGWLLRDRKEWDKALVLMRKDVEADRMSPLWKIHYARLLGEHGKRAEAENVLLSAMSGNLAGHLPVEVFLKACEVSFFLNPYQGESKILNDGLASYPLQTALILAKKADIKQRAAINKWLLSKSKQIHVNSATDKHGSDSTSAFMPDWFDVVSTYDCALTAGSDMDGSDGLGKMILARLFCVEELRNSGDQSRSTAALRDCLQSINPSMSTKILSPVAESIIPFQRGRKTKRDATKQINQEIEDSHVLRSKQWLAVNAVLTWHGFFRSGYRAWLNSIHQAYIEAENNRCDVRTLLHGFRAAMIVADYERAIIYMNYLREIDELQYRNAKAYFDVYQARGGENRTHWPLQNGAQDRRFREYIHGKSVAIVGPAPTGDSCGEEIDGFDVVLRTCYTGGGFDPDEFGSRTTASNYPAWCVREWGLNADRSYLDDLEWYSLGYIPSLCESLMHDLLHGKAYKILPNTQFYFKHPNAIQRIIFDTCRFSPSKIKVFKSNFFLSRNPYRADYYRPAYVSAEKVRTNDSLSFRQSVLFDHDLICQLAFVRNVWKAGVIDVDNACRQVLELTNDQYMARMEALHGG